MRVLKRRRNFRLGRKHGTYIRSQKARDVRALEPDGEAVHPGGEGHRDRGSRRRSRPGRESDAAARAAERPRGQHAEGQDRCGDPARLGQGSRQLPGDHVRGLCAAWRRAAGGDRDRQSRPAPSAACATSSPRAAAISEHTGSVSFLFKKMGVFRLDPASVKDQDELELDLIDHGLEEMGESTGEKGEPQLVIRCAFNDFGKLQEALEARGIAPLSAEHEYICSVPVEIARKRSGRGARADRQARTGRRRAKGVPHLGLTSTPAILKLFVHAVIAAAAAAVVLLERNNPRSEGHEEFN